MHNKTALNNIIAFICQFTKSCSAKTIIILPVLKDISHERENSVSVTLLKTTYKALWVSRHTLAD